ncbi:hypothetical protein HNY73_011534 [Argiope bruennichi]|uniref:Uncharacterized protein n=1 Tax=Argiope bruennichi TaxID=94029 RepID=A0A8T0EZK8_ARGBR|nr:hypothetical protein HNY73_011534 [Argiope bruennichi]
MKYNRKGKLLSSGRGCCISSTHPPKCDQTHTGSKQPREIPCKEGARQGKVWRPKSSLRSQKRCQSAVGMGDNKNTKHLRQPAVRTTTFGDRKKNGCRVVQAWLAGDGGLDFLRVDQRDVALRVCKKQNQEISCRRMCSSGEEKGWGRRGKGV